MSLLGPTHPLASVTHAKLLICIAFLPPSNCSIHKDCPCKVNTASSTGHLLLAYQICWILSCVLIQHCSGLEHGNLSVTQRKF